MKTHKKEELMAWSVNELSDYVVSCEKLITELTLQCEVTMNELKKRALIIEKWKIPKLPSYSEQWTWSTKIVYVLKDENKPMRLSKICKAVAYFETYYQSWELERKISNCLTNCVESGRLRALKLAGIRGRYYALPEWLDESGALLPEFEERLNIWV